MEAEPDTNELLRTTVVRAGEVRTALAELKTRAFKSGTTTTNMGGSATPKALAASPAPATSGGSSGQATLLPLLLPHGGGPGIKTLAAQIPAGLGLSDYDSSEVAALLGAADGSPQLPSGERRASPKTSRRSPWAISAGWPPRQDAHEAQQQHQQEQQQQQQDLFGAAGGSNIACGGGGSFDELLAALRAEGRGGPAQLSQDTDSAGHGALLCGRGSLRAQLAEPGDSYGSAGAGRRGQAAASTAVRSSSAAWDSSSVVAGNSVDSSGSGRAQRLAGTQRRQAGQQAQQQQQQPVLLAPFDRNEAARQLKEKLDLVNAAKQHNEARMRSGSRTAPPHARAPAAPQGRAAPVVPRLSLAALSHTGSASSSRQISGRLSGQEIAQQHVQQWRPWQVLSSPDSSPPQAARRQADDAAGEGEEAPPVFQNVLLLARDERGGTAAAGAALPRSERKESRISLSELLSTPNASSEAVDLAAGLAAGAAAPAAAAAHVAQSRFVAPVTSYAAGGVPHAVPAAPPSAGGLAGPASAHAKLPATAPAAEQRDAGAGMQPASGAAGVLPVEAADPPMHDTPRHSNAADSTPRTVAGAPGSIVKQRGGGHLVGRLASPFDRLQSPPATPLEAMAAAGAAGGSDVPQETSASSAASSPEQASIASSGSPEQQPVSPRLLRFPTLGDEGADGHHAQQQQERQSASAGTASRLVPGERSSSSIGRKRANSEAGCSAGPASVKKRSPEVCSRRQLPRTAELQGGPPAAGEAAAQMGQQQRQQAETYTAAGLFGDAAQLEPPQQVERPSSRSATTRPVLPPQPSTHADRLLLPLAADSLPTGGSRLVMPIVLQHSPRPQRAQQQPQQARSAPPHTVVEPAAAAVGRAPLQPAQVARPPPPPAVKPAPQQQQQQQPAAVAKIAPQQQAAMATANIGLMQQQPQPAPVRAPQAPTPVPLHAPASPEHELPAHSQWVSSRSTSTQQEEQQQHHPGDDQPEMLSSSVLLSSSGEPVQMQTTPRAAGTPQRQQHEPGHQSPLVHATPPAVPHLHLGAAAAAAATAAAAALALARNFTPRRRMAYLEPAEDELCLQEHPQGKQLLAAAPELAGMPGGTLLDMGCQGCVVRKAWVRSNFKLGGSTRCIQLAPGSGGRPEMLYPSGLFRKPLRFAVRRVVVNSPAWRTGDYLVLDTARGMLRLEPGSAAEHARWVLALNTAFLASGAPAAGGRGGELGGRGSCVEGSGWQELAVGEMRWSAAILLG